MLTYLTELHTKIVSHSLTSLVSFCIHKVFKFFAINEKYNIYLVGSSYVEVLRQYFNILKLFVTTQVISYHKLKYTISFHACWTPKLFLRIYRKDICHFLNSESDMTLFIYYVLTYHRRRKSLFNYIVCLDISDVVLFNVCKNILFISVIRIPDTTTTLATTDYVEIEVDSFY